jgi:8-oxo-dGTP pyrophosphatase MutT (NUDIX family)
VGPGGGLEILLITSRHSRRWLIPKGNLMADRSWSAAAAQEAYEEAGALGEIGSVPIGEYRYSKSGRWGLGRRCVVTVYPLAVDGRAATWPEMLERDVRWVARDEAAGLVKHRGLGRLLRRFRP